MRIAYLSGSGQVGGAETALLDMLASVRGATPEWRLLLVAPENGPLVARARSLGVEVAVVPFPAAVARLGESGAAPAVGPVGFAAQVGLAASRIAGYAAALRAALTPFAPDVVHTNGLKMHLLGAYAADAPVVWHVHDYLAGRRVSQRLLRWTAGRCAAVIANSRSVADEVRATLGPGVSVTRMYNAIDLVRFSPQGDTLDLDQLSHLPPAPADTVRVGLVATFARWKGHDVFLRAIAALPRDLPLRAYVIGGPVYQTDGSQWSMDELRDTANRVGVGGRVGFTGVVDRADAALRALDIVVHASTAPEPFGLAIVEAMACARPVVMSYAGGAAELVTPDVDALAHDPGDVEGLAAAILSLAVDPSRRALLGRAARATAERRFDRARLARDLIAVYQAIGTRQAAAGAHPAPHSIADSR